MFDTVLIQQCADPGMEIAIVEQFIAEAGTDNPLAVSITSGNKIILPEQPRTAEDAVRLIQQFTGRAIVRVGITQYPAGFSVSDVAQLGAALVDPCQNVRMGSALFAKVHRIVADARGEMTEGTFHEAITAWQSGVFDGEYVFALPDPGPLAKPPVAGTNEQSVKDVREEADVEDRADGAAAGYEPSGGPDPNQAGIRVDISRINSEVQ